MSNVQFHKAYIDFHEFCRELGWGKVTDYHEHYPCYVDIRVPQQDGRELMVPCVVSRNDGKIYISRLALEAYKKRVAGEGPDYEKTLKWWISAHKDDPIPEDERDDYPEWDDEECNKGVCAQDDQTCDACIEYRAKESYKKASENY